MNKLFIKIKKKIDVHIVFDAFRDNNGKGVKAKDLVKVLQNIKN